MSESPAARHHQTKIRVLPKLSDEADRSFAGHPELTRQLLFNRGILSAEAAGNFFAPDYDAHTHDPFLLKDMDRAVERILAAVRLGEKVVVFSDYDADGIPGAVIFHDFFTKIGFANFQNYIPHRHNEGFGLNLEAVEQFAREGAKLVITVDCGIADVAEAARAKELGIDLIVTDHHVPLAEMLNDALVEKLPAAYAVVNPKRSGCAYPEKMLCGSGVAFKLIQALVLKAPAEWNLKPGWEKWLLDMVGIATLSDMVPLTGENRVLAHYGLKVLRKSPRVGLIKLLRKLKVDQRTINEQDIGFSLSPRINAASRMGVPQDAFKLLATKDETEADLLSEHLNKINDERKGIVASMVKEMKHTLEARRSAIESPFRVIVLGNPNWRPSLLGLAANSLMESYGCPVFLWGRDGDDVLKGSCRSNGTASLQGLMSAVPTSIITTYGGHDMAGGFEISDDGVHQLEEALANTCKQLEAETGSEGGSGNQQKSSGREIVVDARLDLDQVDWQTFQACDRLAPFGVGNACPTFLFENISVAEAKPFGKVKNHTEIIFKTRTGRKVSAISFFVPPDAWEKRLGVELNPGVVVSLVATLEKSTFRYTPELRLRIVEMIR